MKNFLKSFVVAFLVVASTIWAIHNYNQYASSFDRIEAELEKTRAYAEYLPILQEQLRASGI